MRKANVFFKDLFAGILQHDERGYLFTYEDDYLKHPDAVAISMTMPLKDKAFRSHVFFPFFDGLIPEGWLLNIAEKNWKLNSHDRMGLLLACCKDCIGAVSIQGINDEGV